MIFALSFWYYDSDEVQIQEATQMDNNENNNKNPEEQVIVTYLLLWKY